MTLLSLTERHREIEARVEFGFPPTWRCLWQFLLRADTSAESTTHDSDLTSPLWFGGELSLKLNTSLEASGALHKREYLFFKSLFPTPIHVQILYVTLPLWFWRMSPRIFSVGTWAEYEQEVLRIREDLGSYSSVMPSECQAEVSTHHRLNSILITAASHRPRSTGDIKSISAEVVILHPCIRILTDSHTHTHTHTHTHY